MLSRETTPNEDVWTLSEYVEPVEIVQAFSPKLQLATPKGVYANQVNPRAARHRAVCRSFWWFFLAAWVLHFGIMIIGPGTVLKQDMTHRLNDDEPVATREFNLPNGARRLEISHDAGLNNNWIGLHVALVNKNTGEAWQAEREISYYEGVDGGESWSEGSKSDEIIFTNIPPGTYVLAEESEMDPGVAAIGTKVSVAHAGPRWSSLIILLLFLMPFPIFTRLRQHGFEVARWAESDHPIGASSGGDDDDE
jgi:hypothetical protein